MRIGVLGANGQVGAEVCLLLSQQAGIDVVPICRTKFGSAFLRHSGLACRHGQPTEPAQAALLYGDCDVVANFSLAALVPDYRSARRTHDRLIRNAARCTAASTKLIYFSTQSVYGDARVGQAVVFRDLYGQEKLRCERLFRRSARQEGRKAYVFRLGHVCGELQGITQQIRTSIACGAIPVPDLGRASNTVHVATITEAILKVARDEAEPGTFDLMNVPQWSWKDVFEYEGGKIGIEPTFEPYEENAGLDPARTVSRTVRQALRTLVDSRSLRKLASRVMPMLATDWTVRLKATYSQQSASAEIAKLRRAQEPMDAVLFRPVAGRFLGVLTPTAKLLADPRFNRPESHGRSPWPQDRPPAG